MNRSIRAVVLVACIASPPGARGEGGARPQPRSEDPSAEVRHEAPWVEVAGVPPPSTLPLAGAAGKGPDGYPRQYVDRPALRSLLVSRRFAALTRALERLQAAFEADPRRELWIGDAAEALGLPHQRERALLDEWVEASPRSFAPYLARATHLLETGFLHRGTRYARDTSAFEFSTMEEAFAQARRDAKRALALRPGLIEARELLVRAEIASGSREQAERQLEAALRRCPSCYEIRAEWVGWALQPRWGGSLEEMERFAVERVDRRNPRHRLLRGFLYQERGSLAAAEGRRDEAMAAIDRACALGDDWRFLGRRAEYRRQLGDQAGRLADVERAAAARPGHPLVLFRRAWALADARRWEEAGRDLLYVLRSDPTSSEGIWLLPRVIRALDVLAWKAHEAGRAGEARRLYDLARLLAPADPGIAQRSEAVARPGGGAAEDGGPPASGDARPELAVAVVDGSGRPIAGAQVVVVPGRASWETLDRLKVGMEGAPRTGDDGRVAMAEEVGTWTVLALAPGRGAVAAPVEVGITGAEVALALAGEERIDGRVVDRQSRPVPGATVWAIPQVDRLGSEPRRLASATSRPDGAFAIDGLDAGRYRLQAHGVGHAGTLQVREATGGQRGVVLTVDRERVLRGRLLVADPGQPPAPPARFEVRGIPFGRKTFTSSDGRFSIGYQQPLAQAAIRFSVDGRPPVVRELDLGGDDNDAGDVVVGPGRSVRGTVTDPRGAPVAGAEVRLRSGDLLAHTTGSGRFLATVQEEPVVLLFDHPRWLPATRRLGEREEVIDVQLAAGARLKLLAVTPGGEPVPGATLSVSTPGRESGCTTDVSGRCEVTGLLGGECWIAPRPTEAGALEPAKLHVDLEPGGERGVRIRWPVRRSRLTVRLSGGGSELEGVAYVLPGAPAPAEALGPGLRPLVPYHVVRVRAPLENLASDRYTVVAIEPRTRQCALVTLDLKEGEERELTLSAGDGSCR